SRAFRIAHFGRAARGTGIAPSRSMVQRRLAVVSALLAAACPSSPATPHADSGVTVTVDAPVAAADAPAMTGATGEPGTLLAAALARTLAGALPAGAAASKAPSPSASVPCPGGGSLALDVAPLAGSPSALSGTLSLSACRVGGYVLDGTLSAIVDEHGPASFT